MIRFWVLILFLPLAAPLQGDIKVQKKARGRIEIRNALRQPAKKRPPSSVETKPSLNSKYIEKIRELANQYGVNHTLVSAVARAESSFNPYAVSRKGAVGIMQLMPDTARLYGVENRFNAHENLEAGVRHLKYLDKRYNGNLPLILAAYNAGEEAVRKYNGVPPFKETRLYVRRVMKLMGRKYTGAGMTRSPLYKIINSEGRILITNTPPPRGAGKVERLR